MSSEKRAAANRNNAARSTGPRTPAGLARSAQNAVAHGLCSARPVLPGESADDWDRHRAGVLAALRPVGGLEEPLAERAAACLWRLRRVVGYEAAVTAAGLEEAAERAEAADPEDLAPDPDRRRVRKAEKALAAARELADLWADTARLLEDLPDLPDDAPVPGSAVEGVFADLNAAVPEAADELFEFEGREFLTGLGVPPPFVDRPYFWPGWTARLVRRAAAGAAAEFAAYGATAEGLLAGARDARRRRTRERAEEVARLEAEVREAGERVEARRRREVLWRAIPDAPTLDKLTRYEAHLSRQMLQALHTLERLQAARAGTPVPPPVAVDVTVDGPPGGAAAAGG